jgi:hypothetical protein
VRLPDSGDECGGAQRTDALDLGELLTHRMMGAKSLKPLLAIGNLGGQGPQPGEQLGEQRPCETPQSILGIFENPGEGLAHLLDGWWHYDAIVRQQATDLVDQGRTVLDQLRTDAMQGLHVLLLDTLERHTPHVRLANRLTAGRCIVGVSLLARAIGLHIVGAHQAYLVSQCADLAPPMMRSTAGLHADQTPGEIGAKRYKIRPAQSLPQDNAAMGIDAVELKHVLGQINTGRESSWLINARSTSMLVCTAGSAKRSATPARCAL